MPLDADAVRRGCRGAGVTTARQLCRAELERFRAAAAQAGPLAVGCTQEAPLFAETAKEGGDGADGADISFVNLRETAGWSTQAAGAGPKMAALIAAAGEPVPDVHFVSLSSDGVILIYGRDEGAIEAATLLKEHLDVTVLLTRPVGIAPRRVNEFPVAKGTIRSAAGHLGAFDIIVDDFALPAPSSREALSFAPARDGAKSRCDIVLDISGHPPLFAAPELRDGYLRADPGSPAEVLRAVLKARELVGTFDKPRYIAFTSELVRAFALAYRRLPPLPRSLPGRRHFAGRRSRRDRSRDLRRLRRVRRRLPDRRRRLCAAAVRYADAQAARACDRLPRGRWNKSDPALARQ